MLHIEENKSLKDFSSMKIGGTARYFAEICQVSDLQMALEFSKEKNIPMYIVGSGTNMIWSERVHEILLVRVCMHGYNIVSSDEESVTVEARAGENWDAFVEAMVEIDLAGVEAMSYIPGTVGATPVQNVGAYGQEIKDTLLYVTVFDVKDSKIKNLTNAECEFTYRDSIFKSKEKGRYVIISVTLKLSKNFTYTSKYPAVDKYFSDRNISSPSLHNVRAAIIDIRKSKLPEPRVVPNCGSFFENAIVTKEKADELKNTYEDIKVFPVDDHNSKIPTGWLIEKCGLKGEYVGKLKVHDMNALVLTNPDGAGFVDLIETKQMIIEKVKDMFGIEIESEPNIML